MNPLCIGKIVKPFGLKGFLKVIFYIDDTKELESFKSFFIRDKSELSGYRKIVFSLISGSYKFFKVKIEGYDNREQADTLREAEIFVDEAELPELSKGFFYQKDLLDLCVFYKGELFGRVFNLLEVAGRLVLIIKRVNGKELAIPFDNEYIADINLKERKLIAKKLEDLI